VPRLLSAPSRLRPGGPALRVVRAGAAVLAAALACAEPPPWEQQPISPARELAIHLQSFDERVRVDEEAEAELSLARAAAVAAEMGMARPVLATARRAVDFHAVPSRRESGIALLAKLWDSPARQRDRYTRGYLGWALGRLCSQARCGEEAVTYGRAAAAALAERPSPPLPELPEPERLEVYALADLAVALERAGRTEEALATARRAAVLGDERLPPDDPGLARSRAALARLYAERGRNAEAVRLYREALPRLRRAEESPASALLVHQAAYAAAALRAGARREGMDAADQAFFLVEPATREDPRTARTALREAIGLLRTVEAWEAVESLAAAELDLLRGASLRDPPPAAVARALRDLAEAHWQLGLPEEAEREYRSILESLQYRRDPASQRELARTLASYGAFLADRGRAGEAARMRRRAEELGAEAGRAHVDPANGKEP